MAFGKINTLVVFHSNRSDIFKVGQLVGATEKARQIAEIKDIGAEFESSIFTGYDLFDENGNAIARFKNGTYATWFDEPEKGEK
ncbi:MAG: hypothetical protein K0Q53_156 [Massilibacillus sp.]|jgi:hypothetical protein|nr:hypothetical protein [Massilibacillus sp.]